MARGSVKGILHSGEPLSWELRMSFAVDTAQGMDFLHSLKPSRIHRDLKSGNLLVDTQWTVKVADFGTSRLTGGSFAGMTHAAPVC